MSHIQRLALIPPDPWHVRDRCPFAGGPGGLESLRGGTPSRGTRHWTRSTPPTWPTSRSRGGALALTRCFTRDFPDLRPNSYHKTTPILVEGVLYASNAVGVWSRPGIPRPAGRSGGSPRPPRKRSVDRAPEESSIGARVGTGASSSCAVNTSTRWTRSRANPLAASARTEGSS